MWGCGQGAWQGGGVEASGAGGKPEVVSGDTRPLEVEDMVVGSLPVVSLFSLRSNNSMMRTSK